ncbi:helix-turn-helix transcriptional regulator [Neisseriaceae bacterium TC5R-5]|nr:helix-turn-helix transcriptional regulator [Neisseriaceae bacterium TC5R-5]
MPPSKPHSLLADFIRSHRERLSPEQVGLPPGLRRRAKGLRREEVAALSGISTTWLTWIEQGRTQSISAATLSRLADTLLLNAAERDYLFTLAGLKKPESERHDDSQEAQQLLELAISKIHAPAYVLDAYWHAVAWNTAAADLFCHWLGTGQAPDSLLDFIFLNPHARSFIEDWPTRAGRVVAELRADISNHLEEPATATMIQHLRENSAEFALLWQQQDVLEREGGSRIFHHPRSGRIEYQQITLRLAQAPDYKLVMLI